MICSVRFKNTSQSFNLFGDEEIVSIPQLLTSKGLEIGSLEHQRAASENLFLGVIQAE